MRYFYFLKGTRDFSLNTTLRPNYNLLLTKQTKKKEYIKILSCKRKGKINKSKVKNCSFIKKKIPAIYQI